jgi:hypothetical protein
MSTRRLPATPSSSSRTLSTIEDIVRLDYTINEKHSIYGRYSSIIDLIDPWLSSLRHRDDSNQPAALRRSYINLDVVYQSDADQRSEVQSRTTHNGSVFPGRIFGSEPALLTRNCFPVGDTTTAFLTRPSREARVIPTSVVRRPRCYRPQPTSP